MRDKAWGMLKHMQKQIFRHPAPYVVDKERHSASALTLAEANATA